MPYTLYILNLEREKIIMSNKVYIYNPLQASFYIRNGMRVLDTGVHHKTKKAFWVFDFNETEEIYSEWCNREH